MPEELKLVKSRGVLHGFITAQDSSKQTTYNNLSDNFQKLGVFRKRGKTFQRFKYIIACAHLAKKKVSPETLHTLLFYSMYVMDNSK